jgi:hypothetical protein
MSTEFPNEADNAVPVPAFTVPDKVDTLDTIPPILRPQYAQTPDGKFIFRHANGLMSALEKTKVERDEAKTTAKQHQDALRAIVGEFDINDLAEPDTLKQRVVEQILAHEAAQRKDDAGVTFDQKVKEALDAQAGNYEKKLITTQRENAQKAEQVKVAYKALEEQAAVAEFALALNKFQLTEIGRAFLPKQLADDTYRVFDSTSLHTTVFVRNTENNGTDLDNDYRMNAEVSP